MNRHLLHIFPSFEIGGAQRRFAALLNAGGGGFEHSVHALDGCYDALSLMKPDAVVRLDLPPLPKGRAVKAITSCRQHLMDIRPDLLVTYNWGSIEWSLANRLSNVCPMVHVQDGFASDEQEGEKLARRLARGYAYRGADAVVVPSFTLARIAHKSWRIDEDQLHHIPNGIDTARFMDEADTALLARHGIDPDDTIIGTVAGLRPEKNLGRLIEAYHSLLNDFPHIKLVIVGDGFGRAALKMLAERIGLKNQVIFTGNIAEPERILPAFDIFALSSDTEQMPLSIVEAMAAGLPVASTHVGDIRQMVAAENTAHVAGREADQLAASLAALLKDPATARDIGVLNRKKAVAEYGLDKMVRAYDQLFTAVMDA